MTLGGQDNPGVSLHLKVPFASVMSFIFLLKLITWKLEPPARGRKGLSTANSAEPTDPGVAVCAQGISYRALDPSSRPGSYCGRLRLPGSFCPIPWVPKLLSRAGVRPARGLLFCPACEGPGCSRSSPEALPHCHAGVGVSDKSLPLAFWKTKKAASLGVFMDGKPELCGLAAPCPLRSIRQPPPASRQRRPVSTLRRGCHWGLQAACPGRGQTGAAVRGAVMNPQIQLHHAIHPLFVH